MQWRGVPTPGVDESLEWYSHEGITKAAESVRDELASLNILNKALNYDLVREILDLIFLSFFFNK